MRYFWSAFIGGLIVFTLMTAADLFAEKWKPNILDARMLIANEARDVDGKVAWSVEMRRGGGFPDIHVAKANELGALCDKLVRGK